MKTPVTAQPSSIEVEPTDAEGRDADALIDTIRHLERRLEAVSQRESEYRSAVARLEEELRAAGAVQRALMPGTLPTVHGLGVRVIFQPCTPVSGDGYDVFRIDDSHVAFSIADATGHGVPAALLSTLIRRTLRSVGVDAASDRGCARQPGRVLECVNAELFELGLEECLFVAAVYAVFDERTSVLRLARGGGPYPVLLRPGEVPHIIESSGPIVGAIRGAAFEVVDVPLRPGDCLLLYSDGVESAIGARSDAGSVRSAWSARLENACETGGAAATDALLEGVDRVVRSAVDDDATLLALTCIPTT